MRIDARVEKMSELKLPVANIFPNRLNANEMPYDKLMQLKIDVKADDYDAITVSPVDVFYDAKARMDPRVLSVIPADADPKKTYVICDGDHRHQVTSQLGLTHIRVVIRHMTESDAMCHFYRRHQIHGEMDPIKEAELFRQELENRGVTMAKLAEDYNLTSVSYIKTRLSLLNVTMEVISLFYTPPADFPGKLLTEHLKSISYLPKNMQYAVAMMSLERNWRIADIRSEVKRLREGLGLRPVEEFKKVTTTVLVPADGIKEPPSSNPTLIQRHLHPNIDRLLKPNEERVVRAIKKLGEATAKELAEEVGVSLSAVATLMRPLSEMDVLDSRGGGGKGKGKGRVTKIYRLWVAEDQPKSEYARDVALTEAELLEQYPEVFKQEPKEEPVTVREKAIREKKKRGERGRPPIDIIRVGEARPVPIGPEAWRDNVVDSVAPPVPVPRSREPRTPDPLPPLVLNQGLMEDFSEAVYEQAIKEGLDLRNEGLDDELCLEAEKLLYAWSTSKRLPDIIKLGLKVHQIYTHATHKRVEG